MATANVSWENDSKIDLSSFEDSVKLILLIVWQSVRAEGGQMLQETSEGNIECGLTFVCLVGIASLSKAPHILNYTWKAALMHKFYLICH